MTELINQKPPQVSGRAKLALNFMSFLLRRGWMGAAGDTLMVITTTGRKTGKQYSIPIGYKRDGKDIITLSSINPSNWFRNVLANGQATLEIKGETINVQGSLIKDEAERQRIFKIYQQDEKYFKANFGIQPNAPEEELQAALAKRQFIRFKIN